MKKLIAILLIASPCYAGLITHTDYTSGNTITASGQNANENAIVNEFNGNIDNTNIKAGAAIAVNKLAATTANGIVVTDGSGFITAGVNSVTSNSTFTITGLVTFSTITFSSSTSGILGTQTNNTANPGIVGEYISTTTLRANLVNANALGNFQDMGSIVLTPGDWDVTLIVIYEWNGGNAGQFDVGISSTTGASSAGLIAGQNWIAQGWAANTNAGGGTLTASAATTLVIPNYRISLATTTTYYIKTQANFSVGTPQSYGTMYARRVR